MYVCMYVCVCIYIYTHTHTYIYIYILYIYIFQKQKNVLYFDSVLEKWLFQQLLDSRTHGFQ